MDSLTATQNNQIIQRVVKESFIAFCKDRAVDQDKFDLLYDFRNKVIEALKLI